MPTRRLWAPMSKTGFAVLCCLLPAIAGCGGDDGGSDSDQSTATANAPPGPPMAANSGGGGQQGAAAATIPPNGGGEEAAGHGAEEEGDVAMSVDPSGYGEGEGMDGAGMGESDGAYDVGPGGMPGVFNGGSSPGGMSGGYPGSNTGGYSGGLGGYGGGGQPQKTQRPASYADWTDENFEDAIRERDTAVLAAIDDRVKSKPGDVQVAVLLTKLLNVAPQGPQSAPGTSGGFPGYPGSSGAGGYPSSNGLGGGSPLPGAPSASNPGSGGGSSLPGPPSASNPGSGGSSLPGPPAANNPGGGSSLPGAPAASTTGGGGSSALPGQQSSYSPDRTGSPRSALRHAPLVSHDTRVTHVASVRSPGTMALDGAAALLLPATVGWVQSQPGVFGGRGALGNLPGGGQAGGAPGSPGAGGYPSGGGAPSSGGLLGYPASGAGQEGEPAGEGPGSGGFGGYPASGGYGGFGGFGQNQNPAAAAGLQDRQLVASIVNGLLTNNTPEAWKTVHGLLTGGVKCPLEPAVACEVVVAGLFARYDGQDGGIQQTLTAILDGSAPLPPENRAACFRTIAAVSAVAMNKLSGLTLTSTAPPATQSGGFGGLTGYGGGYGEGEYDGGSGTAAGLELSAGGGEGPGYPGAFGGGQPAGPTGPDLATRLELPMVELDGNQIGAAAAFLWGPKVRGILTSQLSAAGSLQAATDPLTVAASLPMADVRHAAFSVFSRFHGTGADPLISSGLLNGAAYDPALLLALKALPRQRPSRDGAVTSDSWTLATQQLVYSLRDKLKQAAPNLAPFPGAFPVRLHRDAVPEVAVVITLPGPAKDFLGAAAPSETRIYYTRTTVTPADARQQKSLLAHYEDRAGGFSRPDPDHGILWIDGLKSTGAERRSQDVIIQKIGNAPGGGPQGFGASGPALPGPPSGAGGGGGGGAAGGTFSIEVIVVEALDPNSAPGEPTLSSSNGQ